MKKIITLSKEDYWNKFLLGKRFKTTGLSEIFAECLLKALGCPFVHKVDGNPIYKKMPTGVFTPDFLISGNSTEKQNRPYDFYVDVQEITEGSWDIRRKEVNGRKNFVREAAEKLSKSPPGYENRIILPFNEYDEKLINQVLNPLRKKSEKYASKERKESNKFGLVSVQSHIDRVDVNFHFGQLTWIAFHHLFLKNPADLIKTDPNFIYQRWMKEDTNFVLPIRVCLKKKKWVFWIIAGYGQNYGKCLIFINVCAFKKAAKLGNDKALEWMDELARRHLVQFDIKEKLDNEFEKFISQIDEQKKDAAQE